MIPRALLLAALAASLAAAQQAPGAITGTVRAPDGSPVPAAMLRAERSDGDVVREAQANDSGSFRLGNLAPGVYRVSARRIGFHEARINVVRVLAGQSVTLNVTLTQAARQLSSIEVQVSPTDIDVSTTELTMRIDRKFSELLPTGRDATSLAALVPGARPGQLWGGAAFVANNYQLDGVAVNHPGSGGDFLALSADWVETLDIRGLGAGAEHGNFQGGIVNAVTKSGSNEARYVVRTNFEAAALRASNLNVGEIGVEPETRIELGGEAGGPIARDRLFYFVAGQAVQRTMRSPNLRVGGTGFQPYRERQLDTRGMAKLTLLPAAGQRLDALWGYTTRDVRNSGINGVDDVTALPDVSQPAAFYQLGWQHTPGTRHSWSFKVAGFHSSESRMGPEIDTIPAVQYYQPGREPRFQNSEFNEHLRPSSLTATLQWTTNFATFGADHRLVAGAELGRGRWRHSRIRNAGMTWRPYTVSRPDTDPFDVTDWIAAASSWGGNIRLDADVASEALFVQDYITLGTRLTLTPGIRHSVWTGYIRPNCGREEPRCRRFDAAHASGFDPRLGIVYDVTGQGTLALKAHWGRYHQGMYSLFFDRVAGANVYEDEYFYYSAPPLADSRQRFTPEQRDAPGSLFFPFGDREYFDQIIRSEAGRVENYRQPYVDQLVVGVEKTLGRQWKAELLFTDRVNGDIVGLIDRNMESNYTALQDIRVEHRFQSGIIQHPKGGPLLLPRMYISNADLYRVLWSCGETGRGPCPDSIQGWTASEAALLTWDPDLVLTTLPGAKRRYQQVTGTLRTANDRWHGEGSLTVTRLEGNVAGATGYSVTGDVFTAGPFVRPNEAINFEGRLPDAFEYQGKVWFTARLPRSLRGGLVYSYTYRERFTPSVEIRTRYAYFDDAINREIDYRAFKRVLGHTIFVEPRGERHYGSRHVVDGHLEWQRGRYVLSADLFNMLGSDALTLINTNIGDQSATDPTSHFAAPRLRVEPRALRIGLRVE